MKKTQVSINAYNTVMLLLRSLYAKPLTGAVSRLNALQLKEQIESALLKHLLSLSTKIAKTTAKLHRSLRQSVPQRA